MTNDDATLYAFSIGIIVVSALMLIVPILLRKSDVFTAWNCFLVGVLTFNGRSGINAATNPHYLNDLKSVDYFWYYVGCFVFFGTTALVYYGWKAPQRLAGRTMLRWAEMSPTTAPVIATLSMSLIVFLVLPVQAPVLGQILSLLALSGPAFALAVMTVTWFRNRVNPILLVMVVVFAVLAVAGAVGAGISRRYLISALSAIPVAGYWVWLRYKPTPIIMATIAAVIAGAIPVVAGFTALRFSLKDEQVSPLQRAQRLLTELPNAIKSGGNTEGFDGQNSVECALGVNALLRTKAIQAKPLESLLFVLANPVPRILWEEKPKSFGVELPYYFGLARIDNTTYSLGLNVVGQCYYDGGLYAHVLYGLLLGFALRYFDELLRRQPGNPLLVGVLAASSAQLIGWTRGCIGVVTIQLVQVLLLFFIIRTISRVLYGTGVVYPRTDHLVPYPVLRSESDWRHWMGSMTAVVPQSMIRRPMSDD